MTGKQENAKLVEIENLHVAFRNDEGGCNDAVRGV